MCALKFLGENELCNKSAILVCLSVFNWVDFDSAKYVCLTKIQIKGIKKLFLLVN